MNRYIIVGIIFFALLSSCSSKSENLDNYLVDISEFNIQNDILKDGDYVEILGSTDKVTKDDQQNFYNLVVVKCEETGDTVNVLVTSFFQSDLNNPRTRFISNSSVVGKIFERSGDLEKLNGDDLRELEPKSFDKVFYDHDFIQVDVRQYPSIAGTLGDYTIEGQTDF